MNQINLGENIIYEGDALSVLKTMKGESVNCIVTSPPYFGLRNYNVKPIIFGGDANCEHEFNLMDKKDPMDRGGNGDHDKDGLHGNKIDYKNYKVGYCNKCQAWKGNLGLENTPQEYIDNIVQIVSECMRVLRKDGVMFLNVGDSYGSHRDSKSSNKDKCSEAKQDSLMIKNYPNKEIRSNWYRNKQKLLIPHRIAIALQEKGFIIRDYICWIKKLNVFPDRTSIGSTMPFPVKDKLLPATEYIFQIVKSEKYFFNLEDVKTQIKNATIERAKRTISSTYTNEIEGNPYTKHNGMVSANEKWKSGENKTANPTNAIMFRRMNQHSKGAVQMHFASYPTSLTDYFISVGCPDGGIVLDPFAGSFTSGISALKQNKKFIGIELNPSYIEIGKRRLEPYLNNGNK